MIPALPSCIVLPTLIWFALKAVVSNVVAVKTPTTLNPDIESNTPSDANILSLLFCPLMVIAIIAF